MALRTRNAAILFKEESTPGTFEAPTPATDGILVEAPSVSLNPQNTQTDEVTGSLDGRGPIPGGIQVQVNFTVYLKGTGTPGTAPEFNDLLRACGWSETVTSTNLVSGATTISFDGSTDEISDSGAGLGNASVGTVIHVSSAANDANNGEFLVTSSAAGTLGVSKTDGSAANLTTESSGASVMIIYGVAGDTATGGTTTSFTGGTGFGGTADLYQGMPVLLSTNPATPAFAFISEYTSSKVATLTDSFGSALDNTTEAAIPANVLYSPASDSLIHGSLEYYRDGVVYRLVGCQGTVSFSFAAGGALQAQFQISGLLHEKVDAAIPSGITYDATRPGIFKGSKMLIDRKAAALATFSVDASMDLTFPENPNAAEGFDPPEITRRNMTGSVDPLETKIATRDILQAFRDGSEQIIHGRALGGNAQNPGQRVGLTVPKAFYTGYNPGDRGGLATEQTPFFCKGQDKGSFLCFY